MSRGVINGLAAPLLQANLDTDQIMPKQFLRRVDKQGLAEGVFHDLRFDDDGEPRPEFVLNRPEYKQATILLAGENFGCGSSREHAVWGLLEAGIEGIIAPSFGEIFYSNAMNNRLLLVVLPTSDVQRFAADLVGAAVSTGPTGTAGATALTGMGTGTAPGEAADAHSRESRSRESRSRESQARERHSRVMQSRPDRSITIDLEQLTVSSANRISSFTISARHRRMFLDRTDLVEDSLTYAKQIDSFAEQYRQDHPWLADPVTSSMQRISDGTTRSGR